MGSTLPNAEYFIGKPVPGMLHYIIQDKISSGKNGIVFKAYSEDMGNAIACKVIPKSNLVGGGTGNWMQEIRHANIVNSNYAVTCYTVADWIDADESIDCVVITSQFITGVNLDRYIKNNRGAISMEFVEQFLTSMFAFLYDLEMQRVQHGDLHSKNILVEDAAARLDQPGYAIRVTDFGASTTMSEALSRDDFESVGAVLRELLKNVNYQSLEARDKYAFNRINNELLAKHLQERDTAHDPLCRRPRALFDYVKSLERWYVEHQRDTVIPELTSPFEFLSCEQIGDSHTLLKALYSSLFLGLPQIEKRHNLILTGPRGCGKSTVFKSLSLRHRVLVGDDDALDITYIGVYYRCDDLYAAFPRYRSPERSDAIDIPIHFLTAALVIELLESIRLWAMRHFAQEFADVEPALANAVSQALGLDSESGTGFDTIREVLGYLQTQRDRARKKQALLRKPEVPMEGLFTPEILPKVCRAIAGEMIQLMGLPIYFFIDDFSIPKITDDLQLNLNRLLLQRRSECFFKISTESPVSFVNADIDGKSFVEGREYELLNLGTTFLVGSSFNDRMAFIEDVFKRRFQAIPGYPVATLEELVGTCSRPTSTEIALDHRQDVAPELWGKENLCDLCSGDIFYILTLVGNMVVRAGGVAAIASAESLPKVRKEDQKKSIREAAGNFLNSVKAIQDGEHLVKVVSAFGTVAFSHLKFRTSRNQASSPPWQASRIEPLEALNLSPAAQKVYDELLRYSLFIQDFRGKSRRGDVVTRLYLRRCLLPQFNLTFSRRDSISLSSDHVEQLLLYPKEFQERARLKVETVIEADNQMGLFEE